MKGKNEAHKEAFKGLCDAGAKAAGGATIFSARKSAEMAPPFVTPLPCPLESNIIYTEYLPRSRNVLLGCSNVFNGGLVSSWRL